MLLSPETCGRGTCRRKDGNYLVNLQMFERLPYTNAPKIAESQDDSDARLLQMRVRQHQRLASELLGDRQARLEQLSLN